MKTPVGEMVAVLVLLCGFARNHASELDVLQGEWTVAKTNQEGQAYSQLIQIEKDQFTFKILSADSKMLLISKGTVKATKAAPFDLLSITNIRAGRSEGEMQPIDDTRALVYTVRDGNFFLASNFDRERENEKPALERYVRAANADSANAEAKLVGKWKMHVTLADNDYDYELRISKKGNGLEGVLISPRSGEHACKLVRLEKDNLTIKVEREIQDIKGTFVYKAKLNGSELVGQFAVRDHEDQLSGTWKASRK
jgi:hypothetical protein